MHSSRQVLQGSSQQQKKQMPSSSGTYQQQKKMSPDAREKKMSSSVQQKKKMSSGVQQEKKMSPYVQQKKMSPKELYSAVSSHTSAFTDRIAYFNTQKETLSWLKKYIEKFGKLDDVCAVFDIDGTILSDKDDIVKVSQSSPAGSSKQIKEDEDAIVCHKMTKALFALCRLHKIPIFIITARPEGKENRKWTIDQLNKCGYTPDTYVELRMMPNAIYNKALKSDCWNFSEYKFKERNRIVQKYNKTIIFNIGDQWNDMMRMEDCAKTTEEQLFSHFLKKLPNRGVFVGSFLDVSLLSIKLPHQ